jgi:hypothetical protein
MQLEIPSNSQDGEQNERQNGDPIGMWSALINLINSNASYWRAQAQKADDPEPSKIRFWTMITAYGTCGGVLLAAVAAFAIWKQFGAMVDANKASDAALKLEQEAWIGEGNVTLQPLQIGDVGHASVSYFNFGKTAAKHLTPHVHFWFLQNPVANEAELNGLAKAGTTVGMDSIGAVYPGIPVATQIDGAKPITESDKVALSGTAYTYLWGELTYTTIFDEERSMTFCGYRQGMKGDFVQCPFHNNPDKKPDPKPGPN